MGSSYHVMHWFFFVLIYSHWNLHRGFTGNNYIDIAIRHDGCPSQGRKSLLFRNICLIESIGFYFNFAIRPQKCCERIML